MTLLFLLLMFSCTKLNLNNNYCDKGLKIEYVNQVSSLCRGEWTKQQVDVAKALLANTNDEGKEYLISRLSQKRIPDVDLNSIVGTAFAFRWSNVNFIFKDKHISFWLAEGKQHQTLISLADKGMSLEEKTQDVDGEAYTLLAYLIKQKEWETALTIVNHDKKGQEEWKDLLDLLHKSQENLSESKYQFLLLAVANKSLEASLH